MLNWPHRKSTISQIKVASKESYFGNLFVGRVSGSSILFADYYSQCNSIETVSLPNSEEKQYQQLLKENKIPAVLLHHNHITFYRATEYITKKSHKMYTTKLVSILINSRLSLHISSLSKIYHSGTDPLSTAVKSQFLTKNNLPGNLMASNKKPYASQDTNFRAAILNSGLNFVIMVCPSIETLYPLYNYINPIPSDTREENTFPRLMPNFIK